MDLSLKRQRAAAEIKLSQCRAQRLTVRSMRASLGGRLKAELSRPGTLVGVFALGSALGGRDDVERASTHHAQKAMDASELDRRLGDIEAALRESVEGSCESESGGSSNAVQAAVSLATSVATRFAASMLLERVNEMQRDDGE